MQSFNQYLLTSISNELNQLVQNGYLQEPEALEIQQKLSKVPKVPPRPPITTKTSPIRNRPSSPTKYSPIQRPQIPPKPNHKASENKELAKGLGKTAAFSAAGGLGAGVGWGLATKLM